MGDELCVNVLSNDTLNNLVWQNPKLGVAPIIKQKILHNRYMLKTFPVASNPFLCKDHLKHVL